MFYTSLEGSISTGTMRAEDLVPKFFELLEELQNESLTSPQNDGDEVSAKERCARTTTLLADIETRKDAEGYFDTEEAQEDLYHLFDLLGEYAKPGWSFGAHEGDGADYGFWGEDEQDQDEDDEDDEEEQDQPEPDFLVCDDCTQAIANDDYTGLDYHHEAKEAEERAKAIRKGLERLGWLSIGEEQGFSRTPCDCCGDRAHGNRHGAHKLPGGPTSEAN